MRSFRRFWRASAAVCVAVVAAVLLANALRPPDLPTFSASGEPMPLPEPGSLRAITVKEFEGLLVGARGHPVVVNVWASWCAPCRVEMPLLQRAADEYGGRALVLGVASKDEASAARNFLDDLHITYPNIFDATGEIRVRLALSAYPTTYFFDSTGELRARVTGSINEQRLAALLEDLSR